MSLQRSSSGAQSVATPSESTARVLVYTDARLLLQRGVHKQSSLSESSQLFDCAYEGTIEKKQLSAIYIDALGTQDRTNKSP